MFLVSTFLLSWPFIIRKLLLWMAFITSITFFLFFQSKNINYLEASFLLSLMTFMPVLAEIPTGVFADTYGRKKSILISICIELFCLIGIVSTQSFFLLTCIFIIWGIGNTFASGAINAWAIERFPEERKDHHLENYFALNSGAFSAGMVIAGLVSTFLLTYYTHDSIWYFRIGITIIWLITLFFIHENFKRDYEWSHTFALFKKNIYSGFLVFKKTRILRYLIWAEFLLSIALFLVSWAAMQSFLWDAWLKENAWWSIYSITALVTIGIPILTLKLVSYFKKKTTYLTIILILQAIIFFLSTLFINPYYAAFLLFFYNISEDLFNPISSGLFHNNISSNVRATIESFQSTLLNIWYSIGMLSGWFIAQYLSWSTVMIISLFFFLGSAYLYRQAE